MKWTVANVHDVEAGGDVIPVGSAVASKALVLAHNETVERLQAEIDRLTARAPAEPTT